MSIINDYDFSLPFEKPSSEVSDTSSLIIQPRVLIAPDPVVVIDPGHGGSDPGASAGGVYEKDINLSIALKLRDYLVNKGATVYMTREDDSYPTLTERYTLANNVNADFFVSVHINSSSNTSVDSSSCIYPNNHDISLSQSLANDVHSKVLAVLNEWTTPYMDNRNLAVLRGTTMPAIITETGFLSNDSDRAYLTTTSGQDAVAYRIYLGLRQWWWGY